MNMHMIMNIGASASDAVSYCIVSYLAIPTLSVFSSSTSPSDLFLCTSVS